MPPRTLAKSNFHLREQEILNCALDFIRRESTATLTIDKLVTLLPYSKGTLYNHFSCKEDLLLALCNRGIGLLAEMFERANNYDGIPRERALCLFFAYMLYAKLNPTQFMLVLTAKTAGMTEKASLQRQNEHSQLEAQLVKSTTQVFADAQQQGVLNPPLPMTLQQITFTCWSQSFGTNALLTHAMAERYSACRNLVLETEAINSMHILLDGLNFSPRSDQRDWSMLFTRMKQDIFYNEVQQLAQLGIELAI